MPLQLGVYVICLRYMGLFHKMTIWTVCFLVYFVTFSVTKTKQCQTVWLNNWKLLGGRNMNQLRNPSSTGLERLNKTMKNLCYIFWWRGKDLCQPSLKSKSRAFTLHNTTGLMNRVWTTKQYRKNHSSWNWECIAKIKHTILHRMHFLVYFKFLQTSNI